MARKFRVSEVRQLMEEQRALLEGLERLQRTGETAEESIRKAAEACVTAEAARLLGEIPVEELNRDRRGLKVKVLRDNGYGTLADLIPASVYQLAAIRGIGEDSARVIHGLVRDILRETRSGVRIRVSLDHRTPETTLLVTRIAAWRRISPLAEEGRRLREQHGDALQSALAEAQPAGSVLRWLFSSDRVKQRAEAACRRLLDFRGSAGGVRLREILSAAETAGNMGGEAAWEDFRQHSIAFFQVLETLAPGVLGTGDALCGLPEDLARDVREEPLLTGGLKCALRPYQAWGVRYILHQGKVLLGDEMGLGKTVQAIAAMVSLGNAGAVRFLVVCPAGVLPNWCREIQSKSSLSVNRVHGAERLRAWRAWLDAGGVAVTTYETLGLLPVPEDLRLSLLVVDEAHYIKNPATARAAHVKALLPHADRLLFMTGTALENRVGEMVALIDMLRPSVAARVRELSCLALAPRFRHLVAPVYYRRKREDVLQELPQLVESREWCSLLPGEEAVYEAAVEAEDDTEVRRVSWNIPALSMSSKARRMLELMEEAAEDGRKIIVFSFFLDTIRAVVDLLGERCLRPIHGAVPPARRQEILDEFDRAPAGTVLVSQIQSGGTGLNIQSASVIILCEPQLKPSMESQAISRAYRMGQTRNVLVYRLLCEKTVDEKIIGMLERKQAVFDAFADRSEAAEQAMELTETTLEELVREEKQRIAEKHRGEAAAPAPDPHDPTHESRYT